MSFCFILVIYTFFALYFQCGYSEVYDVESDDLPDKYIYHLNTTTNSINECYSCDTTICKGSYCFEADEDFNLPFIEIPINTNTSRLNDNNTDYEIYKHSKNKINRYILYPYVSYHDPEIDFKVSTNCTKNSQCLTNKCVDNICQFNEDDIITRYPCENKFDCSDGECDGVCYMPIPPRVNELDSFFRKLEFLWAFILIVIVVFCLCCAYCCRKSKTTKSYKKFNNN
ncbi:hypothetical protein H8356DRAFT_1418653 [Neocallimastix lanati (nom. inval.)]|nr:hypothetical protein H8356DRAFT_1418653 [Neocallimastix sp. JGI-2020a]